MPVMDARETREITVPVHLTEQVRRALKTYLRLSFTERRHWLIERKFTVTGPSAALIAAAAEIDGIEAQDIEDRQW